ncbi:hypothetical protein HanXRQr2_Chr17g0819941 [Helianthus annuus]|uniref:Uncharacterized protein n=1 Tax=Helianthus annuus TaxID=4232 RepID=A0A9K3GVT9_HELAN|nr:hypothetical protein HanXRQr2_Chr17g0819941 [Helianthus annuus]
MTRSKKNFWCSIPQLTTSCVNVLTGMPKALANPKSASFSALVRRSIKRF